MDKIYVDIGNSFIKVSERREFSWHTIIHVRNQSSEAAADEINEMAGLKEAVIASVRKDVFEVFTANLRRDLAITQLTTEQIPHFYLDYDTPKTMGIDRFLTCLAACTISSNDVIVIDTGSACTIDLMTNDFIFRGGVILPGVGLFQQAMKTMLPELPVTERDLPDNWPGRSTDECIRWGVYGAFILSVKSFTEKFAEKLDLHDIYITGGGAGYILHYLGDELNLKHRPDLIFEGMQEFEKRSFEAG